MGQNTHSSPKRSLQYYMRSIHRILGYLAVGMVMVYALSGIILIQRTGDFLKISSQVEQTLAPAMDADQLGTALKIKGFKATEETNETIIFKEGKYDKTTGVVSYVKKEVLPPFNKFIDLHKIAQAKDKTISAIATIFGIVLFLLALTSLFMYKSGTKPFKTNMIYTAIGIIIAVLLVIFV